MEKKKLDSRLILGKCTQIRKAKKTASCDDIESEVKEIVESTRYSTYGYMVGNSLSRVHYIIKNILNVMTRHS